MLILDKVNDNDTKVNDSGTIKPIDTNNPEVDKIFNNQLVQSIEESENAEWLTLKNEVDIETNKDTAVLIQDAKVLTANIKRDLKRLITKDAALNKQKFKVHKPDNLAMNLSNEITGLVTDTFLSSNNIYRFLRGTNLLTHNNARTLHTISKLNMIDNDIWMNHGNSGFDAAKLLKNQNGQYLDQDNKIILDANLLQSLDYTLGNEAYKAKLIKENPNFSYQTVAFKRQNLEIKTLEIKQFLDINDFNIPNYSLLNHNVEFARIAPKDINKTNYDGFVIAVVKKSNESTQLIFYNDGIAMEKIQKIVAQRRKQDIVYKDICDKINTSYHLSYNAINIPIWQILTCGKWKKYILQQKDE